MATNDPISAYPASTPDERTPHPAPRAPLTYEQQARRSAARMLRACRRPDRGAFLTFTDAADGCARASAQAFNADDLDNAGRWARAYTLLAARAERIYRMHFPR